jgi:divalent metal cation (Fe/Co/Zn/Cd) transporter
MRWLVALVVFVIGNLFVFSGIETLLDRHLVEGAAMVLLGALALYAAVLIVTRIKARPARIP